MNIIFPKHSSLLSIKYLVGFIVLYIITFVLLFQKYYYYMDPDASGYLSVAEKVAKGDFFNSINGIWSPLNSWLVAPFIRLGLDGIVIAKVLNGCLGTIGLWLFYRLIKKFPLNFYLALGILGVSTILFIHFSYERLFGDLLLLIFFLIYLNIICDKNFGNRYSNVILASLIGGVSFYAKSYALYFLFFHLCITIFIFEYKKKKRCFSKETFKKIALSFTLFTVISSFWIFCLNAKYGTYIPGQRNISGTLTSAHGPTQIVAIPPIKGNYAFTDDITNLYTENIHPFSNLDIFIVQAKLSAFNFFELINILNQFSFVFIFTLLLSIYLLLSRKIEKQIQDKVVILLTFTILLPLGYLLFPIQGRFLWAMDLIGMLLCGILSSFLIKEKGFSHWLSKVFISIIFCSFLVYPFLNLKKRAGQGKDLFEIAEILKQKKVSGKIMAGVQNYDDVARIVTINYLNKSKYYGSYTPIYSWEEIATAIDQYEINYYLFIYHNTRQKKAFLQTTIAQKAKQVYADSYPGIIILQL